VNEPSNSRSIVWSEESNGFMHHQLFLYKHKQSNKMKDCVFTLNNADLLPPVVAMHACIVLRLWDHAISTAGDVGSRSYTSSNG
jgi:hypothetical protein